MTVRTAIKPNVRPPFGAASRARIEKASWSGFRCGGTLWEPQGQTYGIAQVFDNGAGLLSIRPANPLGPNDVVVPTVVISDSDPLRIPGNLQTNVNPLPNGNISLIIWDSLAGAMSTWEDGDFLDVLIYEVQQV